jgi:hypothetical protein
MFNCLDRPFLDSRRLFSYWDCEYEIVTLVEEENPKVHLSVPEQWIYRYISPWRYLKDMFKQETARAIARRDVREFKLLSIPVVEGHQLEGFQPPSCI